jgi:hypothetical protein
MTRPGATATSGRTRRPGRSGMSAFTVLLALLGGFLLYVVIPNVAPVLRAADGGAGVPGTFTAGQLLCVQHPGHTACGWQGEFRSDDGTLERRQVGLYGDAGDLKAGAVIKARDVGRSGKVYRPAGTHEWVLTALLAAVGLALLLNGFSAGAKRLTLRAIGRPAARRSSESAHPPASALARRGPAAATGETRIGD